MYCFIEKYKKNNHKYYKYPKSQVIVNFNSTLIVKVYYSYYS